MRLISNETTSETIWNGNSAVKQLFQIQTIRYCYTNLSDNQKTNSSSNYSYYLHDLFCMHISSKKYMSTEFTSLIER
jgi:hypothetical protein